MKFVVSAFVVLVLSAFAHSASASNCRTTCYGSGDYRTCNTYCY